MWRTLSTAYIKGIGKTVTLAQAVFSLLRYTFFAYIVVCKRVVFALRPTEISFAGVEHFVIQLYYREVTTKTYNSFITLSMVTSETWLIPDASRNKNETIGCVSVKQISGDNIEVEQIFEADVIIQSEATEPRPIIIVVINKPACSHLSCNYSNRVNVCDELTRETSNQHEEKVQEKDALEVLLETNVEDESGNQEESQTTDEKKTNKCYVQLDPVSRERPRNKAPIYIRLADMNSQWHRQGIHLLDLSETNPMTVYSSQYLKAHSFQQFWALLWIHIWWRAL